MLTTCCNLLSLQRVRRSVLPPRASKWGKNSIYFLSLLSCCSKLLSFPSSSFVIHFNERMCSYSGDWFSLMQNICTIMCSITCLMNCFCPVCTVIEWRLTSGLITPQTNNLIYIAVVTHIWLSWTICGLNKCMNLDPPQIQSNPVKSLSCVFLILRILCILYSNFVILPEWPYTIGCKAHINKSFVFKFFTFCADNSKVSFSVDLRLNGCWLKLIWPVVIEKFIISD